MGSGFLSYAILIETILVLIIWIGFIHWRLSKKKKELVVSNEVDIPDPFEVYMQYINRELSETIAHLDQLAEDSSDTETLTMYQYRLKHLDAEQKAMMEAKGDTAKFWELYRSNIDFVHEVEGEEQEAEVETVEEVVVEPAAETQSMQEELESFTTNSESLLGQSNDVIDLIKNFADKNESEELQHLLSLLTGERDELASQLAKMEAEYSRMINNVPSASSGNHESPVTLIDRDQEGANMSGVLSKQNTRISELNNVVGDLSLELEEKKALVKETEWVTRQLKETEHVVIILEDENSFLREQIKQLLQS